MFSLLFVTVILLVLGLHFVPAVVAIVREHAHAGLIFILNLFFGWTGIGWLILLIWACVGETRFPYPAPARR